MADGLDFLQSEWDTLVSASAKNKIVAHDYFAKFIAAYSEPHRAYHTSAHIQHVIHLLHDAAVSDPAVYWASFYHDYVYRPGASDNEMLSSVIAANQLGHMGVEKVTIERISKLIIATKHHAISPLDIDGSAFLDADMAILGASPENYEKYAIAVRQEFSKTPQFLFNIGRKNFLRGVLNQPRIYITDWFFDKFENTARRNIQQEISS